MSYGSFGQLGQPTDAEIDAAINFAPVPERYRRPRQTLGERLAVFEDYGFVFVPAALVLGLVGYGVYRAVR